MGASVQVKPKIETALVTPVPLIAEGCPETYPYKFGGEPTTQNIKISKSCRTPGPSDSHRSTSRNFSLTHAPPRHRSHSLCNRRDERGAPGRRGSLVSFGHTHPPLTLPIDPKHGNITISV